MKAKKLLILFVLMLFSVSFVFAAQNNNPTDDVSIDTVNGRFTEDQNFKCSLRGVTDAESAFYEFEWFVNNVRQSVTLNILPASSINTNDKVTCWVVNPISGGVIGMETVTSVLPAGPVIPTINVNN